MRIDNITILGIRPYTFFAGIAFLLAFIIMTYSLKSYKNEYSYIPQLVFKIIPNILLFGFGIGFAIEIIKVAMTGVWNNIKSIDKCGFVAYGGIIGIIYTLNHFSAKQGLNGFILNDTMSYTIPIAHGIARLGCLFAGCCYGKEYYGFLSIYYVDKGIHCFPIQIIEAILNITLGISLWYIKSKNTYMGCLIYIYLLSYSVYRFILEFWRGDEVRGIFFGLSSSQYISIAVFVHAVVKIYFYNRRMRLYE